MNHNPERTPPICPASNTCGASLEASKLVLYVSSTPTAIPPVIEVGGVFSGYSTHAGNVVDTLLYTVSIPPDTMSGQVMLDFAPGDPAQVTCDIFEDEHPSAERIANNLRERVSQCPGLDKDGQCGALGEAAVQGALRDVLHVDEFLTEEDGI